MADISVVRVFSARQHAHSSSENSNAGDEFDIDNLSQSPDLVAGSGVIFKLCNNTHDNMQSLL